MSVTPKGNSEHAVANGLNPRGERQGNAKLTDEKVREMRYLYWICDWTQKRLGERYGVTQAHVSDVVSGKAWAHV